MTGGPQTQVPCERGISEGSGLRKLAAAIIGVLAAAGALTACSGGGGSLSKAEYIKQANAICASYQHFLIKEPDVIKLNPSWESIWRDNMTRLRDLKPPKADRARVAKIWDESDRAFAKWAKELKTRGPEALDDEPAIFGRGASLAIAYGLDQCGT